MAKPYCGEIRMFAGSFAPVGWAYCDGSLLYVSEYDLLFNLIGTTYGGDGQTTFALPDLRGRVPIDDGRLPGGGSTYLLGQAGGRDEVTLTKDSLAIHAHQYFASTDSAGSPNAANQVLGATRSVTLYNANGPSGATMSDAAVGPTGGAAAHDNSMPSLPISFIIALLGDYPPPPEEDAS
jgi:microcystin-dependent protein